MTPSLITLERPLFSCIQSANVFWRKTAITTVPCCIVDTYQYISMKITYSRHENWPLGPFMQLVLRVSNVVSLVKHGGLEVTKMKLN